MITTEDSTKLVFELASKVYSQLFDEVENLRIYIQRNDLGLWILNFTWGGNRQPYVIQKAISPTEIHQMRSHHDNIDFIVESIVEAARYKPMNTPVKPCSEEIK